LFVMCWAKLTGKYMFIGAKINILIHKLRKRLTGLCTIRHEKFEFEDTSLDDFKELYYQFNDLFVMKSFFQRAKQLILLFQTECHLP